ncbi:MAG TPA: hypothetical protein VGZ68_04470 [Acidimicrobiales bacterium]|nr:hypothetical protein [Acidimicrobiales bacterium]
MKGITFDEDDPLAVVVCTMTCAALMVVPFTVPRTRTDWPFLTSKAVIGVVFFRYFVADVSFTVTFWAADVVRVKLDFDKLVIVPDEPPAAGPDRAFEPPFANPDPLEL